jgi:hypothetical protein
LWFKANPRQIVCKPHLEKTLHKNRAGGVAQGEEKKKKKEKIW